MGIIHLNHTKVQILVAEMLHFLNQTLQKTLVDLAGAHNAHDRSDLIAMKKYLIVKYLLFFLFPHPICDLCKSCLNYVTLSES
ncbi:hypothetical protein BH09BAC5_BH09BAC5_03080 [soil metagenome]